VNFYMHVCLEIVKVVNLVAVLPLLVTGTALMFLWISNRSLYLRN
jgi:maltodextrin utilization protein YvdJ